MAEESGYRELIHTADWAIEAHGPDRSALFVAAAEGMYALCGADADEEAQAQRRDIELQGIDDEDLLVTFLSELLYLLESDRVVCDDIECTFGGGPVLRVTLRERPLTNLRKEIKAVTYHDLDIHETDEGVEAIVVFDV